MGKTYKDSRNPEARERRCRFCGSFHPERWDARHLGDAIANANGQTTELGIKLASAHVAELRETANGPRLAASRVRGEGMVR